jgi:sensor c-di-GMP phosphodiesterase-like protein
MARTKEPKTVVPSRQSALGYVLLVGAAIAAVLIPVALAFFVSSQEATKAEFARATGYAQDVLRRSEDTSVQILEGINGIAALGVARDCSDGVVSAMRNIDLSSRYIQAMGRVVDGELACSSLGLAGADMALGPADITHPTGVTIRTDVRFPFAPETTFLVVEANGYAAIIHKDLPIDTALDQPDVMLATYSQAEGQILTQRGAIRPDWIAGARSGEVTQFIRDGYLVVVAPSSRFLIGAVVAVPIAYLHERIRYIGFITLPLGLLAGGILALALLRIASNQRSMPNQIRSGLRRNEFHLEYQPIVELASGRWVGAEALLRWQRGKELVRPDLFIPSAEEAGLIKQISRRVVGLACLDAAGLFREFPAFHLGINLSAEDLADSETIVLMDHLTEATGARSGNLLVEATERGFTDPELAGPIIRRLRLSGIAVAVDDFGTGYSSLSTLQALELDYIKIDKSFIDTLGKDAATSSVVEHIIDMARSLNLKMIAEGVETREQMEMLKRLGVQYAQGWLFGRAMPYPVFIDKLRRQGGVASAQPKATSLAS